MINLLFYILLAAVSLLIAVLFCSLDAYFTKKKTMLDIEEQGLINSNWFLKYELYRKGVKGNAKKAGGI